MHLKQHSTSDERHYCRLLPPAVPPADRRQEVEALSALGAAMLDDGSDLSQAPEVLLNVGYTYFGQFLDHDLTEDPTDLDEAWTTPAERIENKQSRFLDLSHLYGRGPFEQDCLYEKGDVRLKVSHVPGRSGTAFDVGADAAGVPVVADCRSIENAIVRQVACVFAKLHNAAVEQHRRATNDAAELFRRARLQTSWQFQRLVRDDFLRWLLDRRVYDSVFKQNKSMVDWKLYSVPVEFSVAAMRFGHSIVREKYLIARGVDRRLHELFNPALQKKLLTKEWEVDWGFFFQGASHAPGALSSRPIDTRVVRSLHQLPDATIRLFNSPDVTLKSLQLPSPDLRRLPVRTLMRGAGLNLPTGQQAAEAFHESVFTADELSSDRNGKLTLAGKVLRDAGMGTATPLWYYILKESELRYNGNRLGPVGSRILAEVFHAALRLDPASVLNHPEAPAGPITWIIRGREMQFDNLRALFAAAPALP